MTESTGKAGTDLLPPPQPTRTPSHRQL